MINSNFENDLILYCKKVNDNENINDFFEEKLYQPIIKMTEYILNKYKVSKREKMDGILNDIISVSINKFVDVYDETRGSAKTLLYVILKQSFISYRQKNSASKRDYKKTFYLEDIKNTDHIIEIELDVLKLRKNTLLENKILFTKITNKVHFDISQKILDIIENPENYENLEGKSFLNHISKICNTTPNIVGNVLKKMNKLIIDIDI